MALQKKAIRNEMLGRILSRGDRPNFGNFFSILTVLKDLKIEETKSQMIKINE